MKANSEKTKQSKKATRRVLAGVLCGASVLSLVLSLVMPPISQAIANGTQEVAAEEVAADEGTLSKDARNPTGKDAENQNNGDVENDANDDVENEANEDTVAADSTADDAEAESAAQPADDGQSVYKVATVANEGEVPGLQKDKDGYTLLDSDKDLSTYLALAEENKPPMLRLTADISSSESITIRQNTTIDLAGHKLYYPAGDNDTFITVESGALTVEDSVKPSDKTSTDNENNPGRPAAMTWDTNNNGTLTYYVTTSMPSEGGLGTTETTTKHVVSGFGAIVAASEGGSVQQVISVQDGGTLNLTGGMITTPRTLGNSGHVILSQGAVNISGGYVTNGNDGGWGGGLCVTGANAKLNMTNGVIAANKAASGGGIYADQGATLNLSGGVISGNATYGNTINNGDNTNAGGYGGGVYTKGANVTISGSACITNNRVNDRVTDNLYNNGVLGGGGIACTHGGTLTMTDGSVTANYSHEAGGGIYAGFWNQWIKFKMTGGIIAGNMSENAEGGGLRISTGTTGDIGTEPGTSNKIYITNNKTMTGSTNGRGGDWGGGGIFIQQGGKLNIVQTLITNNEAGGWGGGVGACPTGETIVSHSNGAAIYNNADHGEHFSAGGHGKDLDSNTDYITKDFKDAGHKDFFLVRKDDSTNTVAVVLGKMLGGGSAGWKGTCDRQKITIDPNDGAEAKYMFGLEAHPNEEAVEKAKLAATTIISGNYSYTHGGGIMTNGDLTVGEVSDLSVYPNMRLEATKVLVDAGGERQKLDGHGYKFKLLRKDGPTEPSWKEDGTLDIGECSVAGKASVDQTNGNITFDSGKDYSSGQYVFYLVEEPISGENELNTKFDETIYKIVVKVGDTPYKTDRLMSIPINYYTVEGVTVLKKAKKDNVFKPLHPDSGDYSVVYSEDKTAATVAIGNNDKPTFTNKIEPYNSLGSWMPAATKVVKGGEMKEFTLEFADNKKFDSARRVKTKAGGTEPQKLYFPNIEYNLSDLKQGDSGDLGRGACKDFTYYVRESTDVSLFSHYTYDKSVYRFDVKMKDNGEGKIEPEIVTFTKIKDAHGDPIADPKPINFDSTKPESTPTFTNTYSTSLPLSGMSGVTLTYLAGAAVLCAAAAWMHIRRKANAKGGKRRE